MKKRVLTLVLAIIMLVSTLLVSCSDSESGQNIGSNEDTAAANTASDTESDIAASEAAADVNDRASAVSALDDSLDFGGMTINVGYITNPRYATDIIGADDGDIINTAVYERNLAVEEQLNIKFNPIGIDEKSSNAAEKFKTAVISGDDAYDINTGHQSSIINMLFDGLYTNMADDEYISFDSPWWATEYMKETVIGEDRIFFLFGDISLMMLKSAGCVYFNKALFEDYFKSSKELYTEVFDGAWTMDKMYEYTSMAYTDLNGSGTPDNGDLYGMMATSVKNVEHFQYDADIRTTARDNEGVPYFILNNERTVSFAEKLYNLYYNNPGAKIHTSDSSLDTDILNAFKGDLLMFNPSWFYTAELLRDMDSDFGIIPYPKLNEEQDEYKTLVHNGSTTFCVPVTISYEKLEIIGAVLEAMAFESYKKVTPAYFEVAMKQKYSRDDTSSQLLDMIYSSMYTDFGYCYNASLNYIGHLRPLAQSKTADFASFYASKEAGAIIALEEFVNLYLNG